MATIRLLVRKEWRCVSANCVRTVLRQFGGVELKKHLSELLAVESGFLGYNMRRRKSCRPTAILAMSCLSTVKWM